MMMILAEKWQVESGDTVEVRAYYLAEAQTALVSSIHVPPEGAERKPLSAGSPHQLLHEGSSLDSALRITSVAGAVHWAASVSSEIGKTLNVYTDADWKLLDIGNPKQAQGAPR